MQIRKAQPGDFDELRVFYIRMNEVINVRNNDFDPGNAVYPPDDMIQSAIANGEQFLGVEDGIIVAAAIVNSDCEPAYFSVRWNVDAGRDGFWVLHALRVLPEYEGRGFAKQMLSFLIGLAAGRGKKAIRLDVLEGYAVERLYLPFGFEYVDTVEILYEDIGRPKRFRLLEKVIDQTQGG